MRKKIIIIGIVVALLAGGWFIFIRNRNGQRDVATIERGEVVEELILSGEIQAKERASLQFLANGELAQVNVQEGDIVTKGQVLAKLDLTSLWASVQQADASLRDAQATLNRVYDQVKGHEQDESYTQIETRTAAETAKDKAYFALVAAREAYSNAIIYAPFSGIVTYVANNVPGVSVLATQPQIEIINPQTINFTVFADQMEIPQLKEGQQVIITLDAFPEEKITGTVSRIAVAPSTEEVGVVYPIEVNIPITSVNGQMLRVGMTGDASFIARSVANVLYVPPQFIKRDSQGQYVMLQGDKKVYVEVGVEGEDRVEIRGEISEGQTIYD